MTTPETYREQERSYAEEIGRGADDEAMAEIGFRPPEPASGFPADIAVEGGESEMPENEAVDGSTSPPEIEDVAAAPDDMTWQHLAYAEYLERQGGESPARSQASQATKAGRRRRSARRLTGRAAVIAEGRAEDPDLR